jgi:hypothetical protein
MAIQRFDDVAEAEQMAQQMAGWDVKVVPWTDLQGQSGWVIQAQAPGASGQPQYLHDDGMVR